MTERQLSDKLRDAFEAGALWHYHETGEHVRQYHSNGGCTCQAWISHTDARREAARRFPRPTVTRPRVIKESDSGFEMRYVGGHFEHRNSMDRSWRVSVGRHSVAVTDERVRAWADLLARPTEEVEEEC